MGVIAHKFTVIKKHWNPNTLVKKKKNFVLVLIVLPPFAILGTNSIEASEQPISFHPKWTSCHVSKNYLFMQTLRTVGNRSDACGGMYIYVHDHSLEFNEATLGACKVLSTRTNMCKFTSNAGIRPCLTTGKVSFQIQDGTPQTICGGCNLQ